MNKQEINRIRYNYQQLIQHILVDDIIDYLYQNDVLSKEHKERIECRKSNEGRTVAAKLFISILCYNVDNENTYEIFKKSLIESKNEHIVEILDNAQVNQDTELYDIKFPDYMIYETTLKLFTEMQEQIISHSLKNNKKPAIRNYVNDDVVDFAIVKNAEKCKSNSNVSELLNKKLKTDNDLQQNSRLHSQSQDQAVFRLVGIDIAQYISNDFKMPENKMLCITHTVRVLVKSIIEIKESDFEHLVLQLGNNTGYDSLAIVIDNIFENCNKENIWIRLVITYAFCAWLAKKCNDKIQLHISESNNLNISVESIGDFVGFYIYEKIGPLFIESGGWEEFINQMSKEEEPYWKNVWIPFLAAISAGGLCSILFRQ